MTCLRCCVELRMIEYIKPCEGLSWSYVSCKRARIFKVFMTMMTRFWVNDVTVFESGLLKPRNKSIRVKCPDKSLTRSCVPALVIRRDVAKPPLRVRFLSKMLLSFSGGEIKQMYYNEDRRVYRSSGRTRVCSERCDGWFLCPCRYSSPLQLLEHYDSVHPA